MKLVIFLLFALTFAFAEVTVKEVNNCYKLNVAKKCPSDDKDCEDLLKEFNASKTVNCKDAQAELDKLGDSDTYPSQAFHDCMKNSESATSNYFLQEYVYDPSLNCAMYATPYYHGNDKDYPKVSGVVKCQVDNCEEKADQCTSATDRTCAKERGSHKTYVMQCPGFEVYDDIIGDDATLYPYPDNDKIYPFTIRTCNSTFVSENEKFQELNKCWQDCAIPENDDDHHESGAVVSFSLAILAVILGALV